MLYILYNYLYIPSHEFTNNSINQQILKPYTMCLNNLMNIMDILLENAPRYFISYLWF